MSLSIEPKVFKPCPTGQKESKASLEKEKKVSTVAHALFSDYPQLRSLSHDYSRFQNGFLAQLGQMKHKNLKEWQNFCVHLDACDLTRQEKLLILKAASQCIYHPVEPGELPHFLTRVRHLKQVSGVRLLKTLFSPNISREEASIAKFTAVCQLSIDLHEEPDLHKLLQRELPSLTNLSNRLQERKTALFAKRYPEREIDEAIRRFKERDEIVKFPLSERELSVIKEEYLALKTSVEEIKSSPNINIVKEINKCVEGNDKPRLIALLAETLQRTHKIVPYDTQLLALLALLNAPEKIKGRIAQMKTGEGKSTMIALLAAYSACHHSFVDVVTSSSYLAKRDSEKYTPFYEALGLTTSCIGESNPEKRHFRGEILYGTNTDFEFAFLRDGLYNHNLRNSLLDGKLQPRRFDVVIVDEVDNLFLDAAMNSALLSLPGEEDLSWIYPPILKLVKNDLCTPDALRKGLKEILPEEYHCKIASLKDRRLSKWISSAKTALNKKMENRDYIVQMSLKSGREISIMDFENTGRVQEGCQWKDGLHQLLQAKHGISPTPESCTAASVAHPTYFLLYKKIYGLTGTMGENAEREEILEIYGVDSFDVPPHRDNKRVKLPSLFKLNVEQQHEAIYQNIKEMHDKGRPCLPLFKSIEASNAFSKFLKNKGLKHQLLNERQQEDEAYLVGRAGDKGMVTIATNTAGRGTDIELSPESIEAGGLHVIFTFYPLNMRVEEQGDGRAGRQGQPGSCCMILSSEDDYVISLLRGFSIVGEGDALLPLLNELRTKRIEKDSLHRSNGSKMERIYFEKLQYFFRQIKELRNLQQNTDFKQQFIDACNRREENAITGGEWSSFFERLNLHRENHSEGSHEGWEELAANYVHLHLTALLKKWGEFYNKLHDEIETYDVTDAQQQVDKLYAQAGLSLILDEPGEYLLSFLK